MEVHDCMGDVAAGGRMPTSIGCTSSLLPGSKALTWPP